METVTAPDAVESLTAVSDDLPPALFGYAAMHVAMRRDAARLRVALEGGRGDGEALRRWWRLFSDVIVRHHQREDDLIWPMLAAVDPSFADDVVAMDADHAALDAAMEGLGRALVELGATPASHEVAMRAAATFADVLTGHLEREERAAFHRLTQHPQRWAEVERCIERGVRMRDAAFELPWMHDGLDLARSRRLWARVPRVARPLARLWWQPRYRRLVAAAGIGAAQPVGQVPWTGIAKPPSGTRGVRTPPRVVARLVKPALIRMHKRSGDRFRGFDVLYLTTVGARSGQLRTTPVARFDDGVGGWVVVASASGAARHPAWYHNAVAHPDRVRVEVGGRTVKVAVDQLEGDVRDRAWQDVVDRVPMFGEYSDKTDRQIPLLRLTPAT
jgi:deazaflavin-dependent oxidoreductase (nitroreductase family)